MSQPGRSVIEDVETWSGKGPRDENFPVGSIIIARKYREPMHRYYTFARNADDIADSSKLSPPDKLERLDVSAVPRPVSHPSGTELVFFSPPSRHSVAFSLS